MTPERNRVVAGPFVTDVFRGGNVSATWRVAR
jgi:hypothetical protein